MYRLIILDASAESALLLIAALKDRPFLVNLIDAEGRTEKEVVGLLSSLRPDVLALGPAYSALISPVDFSLRMDELRLQAAILITDQENPPERANLFRLHTDMGEGETLSVLRALEQTLSRRFNADQVSGWETDIISMAHSFIAERLSEPLSLVKIAGYLHMNPSYFSRYYHQHTGQRLSDYILKERMESAIRLLRNPTLRVKDICQRVGYKNTRPFYRAFRQYTGLTPNEYRERMRSDALRQRPE